MTRRAGSIPEATKANLIRAAKEEFYEYGFSKASLRRICAKAEVTTGAMYFFFQDKEDIFTAVVSPVTNGILAMMRQHFQNEMESHSKDPIKEEAEDIRVGKEIIEAYFAHKDICEIILNNKERPVIVHFFEELTRILDGQMQLFADDIKEKGMLEGKKSNFNRNTVHWFSHLQVDMVMHIIEHNYTKEQALEQLQIMIKFLRGGARALL